jgi:MoaA/NifB/PqqE/SkfB family radical SAM enzyme
MNYFNFNNITEYQLSITNYCNAACPQCVRNVNGGLKNPYLPLRHLSREAIDRTFDPELVNKLTQVFFCGGFGDPCMHPDFLDILRDFRRKRKDVWLYIHSNGGMHNAEWWAELAHIIGPWGQIDFGIDGLADTNHLYRKNVKWSQLIDNVTSYIQNGGRAQWNFIIFKHNQHQIEETRQLSQQLGFRSFLPRKTGRFFNANTALLFDRWPVLNQKGNIEYYLEPSTLPEAQNASLHRIDWIESQPGGWKQYHNTTKIRCVSLMGNKVVITADGLVLPCNFFEHNLYDARYHDTAYMPGSNDLCRDNQGRNQIQELLKFTGHENININNHSLENIFKNNFWNTIVDSWDKTLDQGRIYECANTCGEHFTKVWDQGESIQ